MKEYPYDKPKKVEVCADKSCFERKNKEAEEKRKKKEAEAHKVKIEKVKEKAAKTKMDRNFWAPILADNLVASWNNSQGPAIQAYSLDIKKLKTRKAALEYFTSNKKLNLEEIFRFITYWEN